MLCPAPHQHLSSLPQLVYGARLEHLNLDYSVSHYIYMKKLNLIFLLEQELCMCTCVYVCAKSSSYLYVES